MERKVFVEMIENASSGLFTTSADEIYRNIFTEMLTKEEFMDELIKHFWVESGDEIVRYEEADDLTRDDLQNPHIYFDYDDNAEDGVVRFNNMAEYTLFCIDYSVDTEPAPFAIEAFEKETGANFDMLVGKWFTTVHGRVYIES